MRRPAFLGPAAMISMLGLCVTGCMLDRSGTRPPDSGAASDNDGGDRDAALLDAGGDLVDAGDRDASLPGDDAGTTPPPDAGTTPLPDAGIPPRPDAGMPARPDASTPRFDAGPPRADAGTDAGTDAGPASCDAVYGGAVGYQLCLSTPTECEFFTVEDRVRTCDSTCAAFGGTCLRRWRPAGRDDCERRDADPRSCADTGNRDDICVCSR